MFEDIKNKATSLQILTMLLSIAVGIYLFQLLWGLLANFSDILLILFSAWLLGFILEPIVMVQQKYMKTPKILAAFIVYILFFGFITAIVFLFFPVVASQTQKLLIILPKYLNTAPPLVKRWSDVAMGYLGNSLPIITSFAQFFLDAFLVIIISFYLIIDKERIYTELKKITPRRWHHHVDFTRQLIDTTFASFLRMQVIFAILSGIATWVTLTIFNVPFTASTALFAGVLTLIPLIGPILAMIPPLLIPILTNPTQAILIFIVLFALQQLIFNIIGPKMMSRAFKLHPIIVILSFLVGFKIAGGAGAIFAVPILGILVVLLHQFGKHILQRD